MHGNNVVMGAHRDELVGREEVVGSVDGVLLWRKTTKKILVKR